MVSPVAAPLTPIGFMREMIMSQAEIAKATNAEDYAARRALIEEYAAALLNSMDLLADVDSSLELTECWSAVLQSETKAPMSVK